jgi:hypothetical protein
MVNEIVSLVFEGENPDSVFEIGSASGELLRDYWIHRERKVAIGGIDLNPDYAEENMKKIPGSRFLTGDIRITPWPIEDKSYDIAFSIGTLILMEDPVPVIKEMLRIAKKVILAEPHGEEYNAGSDSQPHPYGYHLRCRHDYQAIFDKLKLPVTITNPNPSLGKHIIKC